MNKNNLYILKCKKTTVVFQFWKFKFYNAFYDVKF